MKKDKAYLKDILDAISDIDIGRTKWLIKSMVGQQDLLNSGIAEAVRYLLSNGVNKVVRLS
ncbi:MAG: hypothetical protein ACETWQ_12000 [Phycisphaerae bacterium]